MHCSLNNFNNFRNETTNILEVWRLEDWDKKIAKSRAKHYYTIIIFIVHCFRIFSNGVTQLDLSNLKVIQWTFKISSTNRIIRSTYWKTKKYAPKKLKRNKKQIIMYNCCPNINLIKSTKGPENLWYDQKFNNKNSKVFIMIIFAKYENTKVLGCYRNHVISSVNQPLSSSVYQLLLIICST